MAEHIVSSYDNDLQGLRQRISEMVRRRSWSSAS